MRRLLDVHRAHRHLIAAGSATDAQSALGEVRRAAQVAPDERVVAPLLAIRTALTGDVDGARELLERAAEVNPATWQWAARSAQRAAAAGDPHAEGLVRLVAGHVPR